MALVTTHLDLSVEQIFEYYSAPWKIEAGFREIQQDIGSAQIQTQTRNPEGVTNYLQFRVVATTPSLGSMLPVSHVRRADVVRGRRP